MDIARESHSLQKKATVSEAQDGPPLIVAEDSAATLGSVPTHMDLVKGIPSAPTFPVSSY